LNFHKLLKKTIRRHKLTVVYLYFKDLSAYKLWFPAFPTLGIKDQTRCAVQGDSLTIQAVIVSILALLVGNKMGALRRTLDVGTTRRSSGKGQNIPLQGLDLKKRKPFLK